MPSNPSFFWRNPQAALPFSTAVCLHGHTLHSEECLSFLPRYLDVMPGISQVVSHYQRGPRAVDFARAWWTPPLTPSSALRLESEQILRLGLRPLVSLTDHDNIEAGMALQITEDRREVPVSVEWTVPYERSILHLGIHNLAPATARVWMSAMAGFTAAPAESRLREILAALAATPDLLIVLNHPYWLEEGVEEADHQRALDRVLRECLPWFHAFELNGTRRWHENSAVLDLARAHSRPVISGGDRHAGEPAACLNITNARSFSEFAAEVRAGHSAVLFMPHYREPMPLRVLEAARDILRRYPEYPGRELWTDRIFYRGDDGFVRPLSQIWGDRVPPILRPATGLVQLLACSQIRQALRLLLSRRAEAMQ
jgi:hypothetical protein